MLSFYVLKINLFPTCSQFSHEFSFSVFKQKYQQSDLYINHWALQISLTLFCKKKNLKIENGYQHSLPSKDNGFNIAGPIEHKILQCLKFLSEKNIQVEKSDVFFFNFDEPTSSY